MDAEDRAGLRKQLLAVKAELETAQNILVAALRNTRPTSDAPAHTVNMQVSNLRTAANKLSGHLDVLLASRVNYGGPRYDAEADAALERGWYGDGRS